MCTRYVLADPADAIRDLFRVTGPMPNWPPNYNVAPTHIMPIVRSNKERTEREVAMMEWGPVPWFSKDGKARVEHDERSQRDRPTRDEAFAILRQLIERVSVHPRENGVEIELRGEIVAMVEVALGSDAAGAMNNKAALRRPVLDDGSRRSVKVVAGIGFEPMTFRL